MSRHDNVRFVVAAAGVEVQNFGHSTPGEIMGVWVNHASGTGDITLAIVFEGQATTVYTEATPVDGVFNPVRRMQTTAGADATGAGEFQHFYIPEGAHLRLTIAAAWEGTMSVAIRC